MSIFRRLMMSGGKQVPSSGYIINQSGTYTSAQDLIRNRDVTIFEDIRAASHLYVGELVNDVLQCKLVSDINKQLYSDNTSVVLDGNKDLFMKLPQFWWKVEKINGSSDIIQLTFSLTQKDGWYEWAGNVFIGVYQAVNLSSKLYSRRGYTPTVSLRTDYSHTYSRARGSGYRLVTYQAHQMMALLSYGLYGTTNIQSVCGGMYVQDGTTGICDDLGMTDTTPNDTLHSGAVNFWGLENWWGWKDENIDNLAFVGSRKLKLTDREGSKIREITNCGTGQTSSALIRKMVLGDYADIIPSTYQSSGSVSNYYADYGNLVGQTSGRTCARGGVAGDLEDGHAGINYMYGGISYNSTSALRTNRLLYEGDYVIIT